MKKLLGIIFTLCLVFSMVACSSQKFASVDEYIQSDAVQQQIAATADQSASQGIKIDVVAEDGNKMVLVYTLETQVDAESTAAALEAVLDEQASTFEEAAKEMASQVDVENPVVVLRYVNADGTEILSKEYTAQ